MKTTLILSAAAVLVPLAALAQTPAADITVTGAYARSSNPKTGAAFMTIVNNGSRDCTLAGADTDAADKAELHTSKEEGGVMKMLPLESVPVPAGGTHELARGADHIMLMGLKQPLKDGDHVALTLNFGDCGTLPVELTVDNRAGMAQPMENMDHGQMHGHGAAPSN